MNNPFISLKRRLLLNQYKKTDSIYVKSIGKYNINSESKIIFDLSDETFVHLGDALFFIPLIIFLSSKCNTFIFIPKSKKNFYLDLMSDINIEIFDELDNFRNDFDLLITVPYCLLSENQSIRANISVGLGHSNSLSNIPYPIYLAFQFATYFFEEELISDIESQYFYWSSNLRNKKENIANENSLPSFTQGSYFIVSPFVGSGKFRDFFNLQRSKIIAYAKWLNSIGYTPILVGSAKDNLIIDSDWIDLRGYPLDSIATAVMHNNVKFGIGFDNFWMHYFELNRKKYLTKFRGRLLKKYRDIHFFSVNKSFGNSAKWYIL